MIKPTCALILGLASDGDQVIVLGRPTIWRTVIYFAFTFWDLKRSMVSA